MISFGVPFSAPFFNRWLTILGTSVMQRPLVPVALLYGGGIILADWVSLPLSWLLAVAFGLASAAMVWSRTRPYFLAALLVVAGFANLTFHTARLSPQDLRLVIGENQERLTLRGKLTETPYYRIYELDEKASLRTVAFVEAESALLQGTNWQPVAGRVMVSTAGALPKKFFGGQVVEITGFMTQPKQAAAEGLFDYRAYLRRQGIHYQLRAASYEDWRVVSTPLSRPVADRFCAWAQQTLARGLPEEDEPLRLLWAMTLGWKTALSGEVAEPFMRSGTMHIFAISGLHIALIAIILIKLLQVCKVPRTVCGVLVIPLIWFYTGVTGWQASAIRATIMSTVIVAGWSLKRPSDLLNSLAAAAFIILLWDPQQLFQASFQLSFCVVLSLALFAPVLIKVRQNLMESDPMLPRELVPRWRRGLNWSVGLVTGGLITSLAAWIGSAPLIAYYFHLFTPGSLLANLLVVPLSSLALACNIGSLIVGEWFPACAELLNHSAWLWMSLMIWLSEWFAWMRGACFYIASPTPLTFVFYYAVVCSLMAGWLRAAKLRLWVGSGLGVLALLWLAQWQVERSATRLTILPLHGGEAIYLDASGQRDDCLIDCGNEEAAQFTTAPFLRARGVNSLRHFVLTHGDARHVAGAELIRADFAVREIAFSPLPFRSPIYRELRQTFERIPGLARNVVEGDQVGPWRVLHPSLASDFPRADDKALVLRGEFEGTRVVLLSDLGRMGQNALPSRVPDLRADIVIAGLPQQEEPLAEGLLDLIRPRLIIIADAEYPATARAGKKLQDRLAQRGVEVIYTRDTGALTLTFHKSGWQLRGMNDYETMK